MNKQEAYTGKEMCEAIVEAWEMVGIKKHPTADELWNYSPTGELSEIFFLHDWAMVTLGRREESIYLHFIEKGEDDV